MRTKAGARFGSSARGRPHLADRPRVVWLPCAHCVYPRRRPAEPRDPPRHASAPRYGQPVKADDCLVTSSAIRGVTKDLSNSVCSAGGGKHWEGKRRPDPEDLADLRTTTVTMAVQRDKSSSDTAQVLRCLCSTHSTVTVVRNPRNLRSGRLLSACRAARFRVARSEWRGRDIDHVRTRAVLRRRLGPMDIALEVGGGSCGLGERDAELLLILGRATR
jgi:hypothetical protein